MNTTISVAQVRQAIKEAGDAWLFNYWGTKTDTLLEGVREQILAFEDEYERRFGERPDPFALLQTDPHKGRAFFQNDTLMLSVEMKIMIWRVFLGCEILRVKFDYELSRKPFLIVTLRTPYDEEEEYHGRDPWDFKVLRHFGAASTRGGLVLQAYYPTRCA